MLSSVTLLLATVLAAQPSRCSADELMRHVTVLAADSMMGRAPGSRGDAASVAYLTRALEEAVGTPRRVTTQQVFVGAERHARSQNIIATIPGTRPGWVVVTAHHDGLGVGKPDATGDSIYNGANDNAVGVAILICVVRELASVATGRGVIAILTAAEESGKLGARAGFDLATVSFESSMYWAFDAAEFGAAGVPALTIGQGTRRPAGSAREAPVGMPTMRQRYHSPSDEVAADWEPAAIRRFTDLASAIVEAARTHVGEIRLIQPNAYQTRP